MMKMKKIMGVLALTSILGSSVTGPLNVLLAEAFASQKGVNSGYVVPNPNLYTATGKRIDAGNGYFTLEGKKMQHGDHVTNDEGEKGLVGGSSLFLEDRPNLFFYSDSSDMTVSHYRVGVEDEQENVLSTELKTVPGKEYVLTFDLYTRIGSVAASDFGDSLTKMGITDKNNVVIDEVSKTVANDKIGDTTDSNITITFTATDDISKLFVSLASPDATVADKAQTLVSAKNINVVKTDAQVQKDYDDEMARQVAAEEALVAVFADNDVETGMLKPDTDQNVLDDVQILIDALEDEDKKAELQADLDTAQDLLNDKLAAEQAEKERQEAAEGALKDLFKDEDVASGALKPDVDQGTLDNVQDLIDAITDEDKKAELQADLDTAQDLLNDKLAAEQAEKERQEAAEGALKDLFKDEDVASGALKPDVDQGTLDNVQDLIDAITDEDKKAELQADLDTAQDLLNDKLAAEQAEKERQEAAEDAVKDLFKDEDVASGELKPGVDQGTLDNVQDLIDAITDEDKKAELQADLDTAQDLLDQMNMTTGEVEVNEFVVGADNNIIGTYNGDVKRVAVTVNGTEYRGGTLADGMLRFYSLDKIKNVDDEVVIRGLDQNGRVLDTKTVALSKRVTSGTISPNTVVIPGDNNITGTYTGDVRKVIVTVNGTEYRGGTLIAGEFKFYSLDKIRNVTDEVVITALDSKDKVLDTKTVQVSNPQTSGTISPDTLTIPGDKNMTGTYAGDVKRVVVTVNGIEYRGGTVENGVIKFYTLDKIRSVTDVVSITAFDAYGKELDRKEVILQASTK